MPREDEERGQGRENRETMERIEEVKATVQTQAPTQEPVKPVVPSIKPAETKPNAPEISAELKAHIERANQERELAKKQDENEDPEGIRKGNKKPMQTSETANSLNVDWLDKKIV